MPSGWFESAERDLSRALGLREDAAILYNRGRVREARRRWAQALDDFSRALELARGEVRDIVKHRDRCLHEMRLTEETAAENSPRPATSR